MRRCVIYERKQTLEKSCASAEIHTKESYGNTFFSSTFFDAPCNFCSRTTSIYDRRCKCARKTKQFFEVLTSVSAGTSVTKTGRSGNWIAVRVNGIKGYIYKSYLSGSKNTSTATVSKSTSYRAVITASSVNLRAKPSFSSRVKGSLSAGQAVTVCSTNGSWKKVQTSKGKKGYVYGIYVRKSASSSKTTAKKTTTASSSSYRTKAVSYAKRRVGDKYSQSRRNQKGYADCSSLMRDAYKSASGKYIGNTTYEQLELMHSYLYSISSVRQATVGDLVFHQNGSNHVGIYLGNGKVLHASQTAGKVKISTFSSSSRYWDTGCNAAGYCVKH